MIRQLLAVAVLAFAMALGTAWVGWWAVPVFGAVWGVTRYGAYPAATAAVAAAFAWVVLLGLTALRGPAGEASRVLGSAMGMPGWLPLALAVLFPAALAAAAAGLARAIVPLVEGGAHGDPAAEESPTPPAS
jgi:hypothetical protein